MLYSDAMQKILIHLTNKYPFGTGENFSENEIKHFSQVFDKIFLIPLALDEHLIQTAPREVPSNVEIYTGVSPLLAWRRGTASIAKIPKLSIAKGLLNSLKQFDLLFRRPQHFALETWFNLQKSIAYSSVKQWLGRASSLRGGEGSEVTIYSTWLHLTAAVAVEIKRDFFNGDVKYLVSRAHRYDLYAENNKWKYLPGRKELLRNFDMVFPVSKDGVDYLQQAYPEYASKVDVRRLGAEMSGESLVASHSPLHIFSCSWVKGVKRLDLLIRSLGKLQEQGVGFHWYHIGDGEEHYFEYISNLAQETLDEDSYTFLGYIPNSEVISAYKKFGVSVVINVSESEGVPVSLMEATSVGVPIIATDVGGSRELFRESMFEGLLSPNPSPQEIAAKLLELSTLSTQQYENYCQATFESWNDYWNVEINLKKFASELVAEKVDPSPGM